MATLIGERRRVRYTGCYAKYHDPAMWPVL